MTCAATKARVPDRLDVLRRQVEGREALVVFERGRKGDAHRGVGGRAVRGVSL
jgi:hypothetical protein